MRSNVTITDAIRDVKFYSFQYFQCRRTLERYGKIDIFENNLSKLSKLRFLPFSSFRSCLTFVLTHGRLNINIFDDPGKRDVC